MPNRLADATSPYLQQHADNPVDWMEWGEQAFARARAEDKPIFLSIGYSTCHWCHVMAHESFENRGIAQLLNAHFVAIKVDREERPDVDRVYMTYVQALTGHGGWPLSAWLTPELKPFFGGTYFPPEDRPGRPGFPAVLQALADGWANDRAKLIDEAQRVIDVLGDYVRGRHEEGSPSAPAPELADAASGAYERCYQYLYESFDEQWGGFGGAPKFPRAANVDFLFRCAVIQGTDSEVGRDAVNMAATTLRRMSEGGIHDHVGGGFHRYAVDDAWFVPHFEKMLYDQAQIAANFLDAHRFTGDERYAWTARDTLDYVLRDLAHPGGAFFAAEDADSEVPESGAASGRRKAEGAFYLWTQDELQRVLRDDAVWVADHFGVMAEGNVPTALDPQGEMRGGNVLKQQRPLLETAQRHHQDVIALADRLAFALDRLRAVRALRPRPHRDEKIIAAWNGLMISALARAAVSPAACLADKRDFYAEAATRAAVFLHDQLYDPATGRLHRTWRDGRRGSEGFAEDYAAVIAGLLDLYECTFAIRWLQWAERLQHTLDEHFWDEAEGGYFQSRAGDPAMVLRLKDDHDGAEPSANSLAASNLLRLSLMLHDDQRAERAHRVFRALQPAWSRAPQALPAMLVAMEWALQPARQVVLTGDLRTTAFQALAAEAAARPGRRQVRLALTGAEDEVWLTQRTPALAAMAQRGGTAAYVCENFTCHAPATTPEALRRELDG